MTEDISKKILDRIKEEKICPTPRWQFLCKNWALWLMGAVTLVVGGLAVSVIIFMTSNNEWELAGHVANGKLFFLMATLPYAWLLLTAIFIFLADYQIRQTKHGYRFSSLWLAVGSLIASTLLGGVFYVAGAGEIIDDAFIRHVPYYSEVGNRRGYVLMQPERGIVGGLIINVADSNFEIRAMDRSVWMVDSGNAQLIGTVEIMPGRHVIVIGESDRQNFIEAKFIKELLPGNGQRKLSPPEFERIKLEMRNR